jgi:ketosteroid isomerase-like protein
MKRARFRALGLGILIAAVFLPAACVTSGGALPPGARAGAEDLVQRFTQAMSRKDLDGAMSCFWDSPELIVVLFGNVQRGYDSVRSGIAAMFEQNETVKLRINEISYVPVGGMIMAVGTATYDLKPKGGPAIQLVERWTDLEAKIDGRWVYVLDHATMVPE